MLTSAAARDERRGATGKRAGDQRSSAWDFGRTPTRTRDTGRTLARPGCSSRAQALDDALAGIATTEQDRPEHERREHEQQAIQGSPSEVAQQDNAKRQKSGQHREPEDSLAYESTTLNSHRRARLPAAPAQVRQRPTAAPSAILTRPLGTTTQAVRHAHYNRGTADAHVGLARNSEHHTHCPEASHRRRSAAHLFSPKSDHLINAFATHALDGGCRTKM